MAVRKKLPIPVYGPSLVFSWLPRVKIQLFFTSFDLKYTAWTTEPRTGFHQVRKCRWEKLIEQPHLNTLSLHKLLRLRNTVFSKVKNAGCQYGIGFAFGHSIGQVLQVTYAARSDHRHMDCIADGAS